nr:unnamed protein product [Callosobruchus analis]
MAITPGKIFDTSLDKYPGEVTLPEHTGITSHVLVFKLGGDSVNGAVFQDIINSIFERAQDLQLNIVSVTSDMGACNQALWKVWGISAGRHSPINSKIRHPLNENKIHAIGQQVSQYLKNPSSSSYDEDDREFISGFLDTIQAKQESYGDTKVPTEVSAPTFKLQ